MVDIAARQTDSTAWQTGSAWLFALGLLAAAVVFNQSAVHWRGNINDSHYYAYCGWRVSQGAIPYLDVWNNKPPGTWWVNAAGFLIRGPGVGRELLICSVAVAAAIVGFVGVARTVYHRSLWLIALATGCVLLTHLRYECGGNRTETFVVPCEILAVLGYLRWRRGGRWGWLIIGGLFAGAAPLFKQSGLGALGACALHLAWSQLTARWIDSTAIPGRRWWVPWTVGGAAVLTLPVIAAAVLAWQGALGQACFAVLGFNQAYFAVSDATWLNLRAAFQPYLVKLPPMYGLFVPIGVGVLLRVVRRSDGHGRGNAGVGVFWLWLLATTYLACVGPGRQAYHLATTLAPLGLLALYPLHWLVRDRNLVRRIVARPSMAVVVVVYLYVLMGLVGESVVMARCYWVTKPHWYALRREPPAAYEVQAAEIVRLTRPDETVYVWGWSPGTYRFAYRHSPSRFSTLEKLGQVGKRAEFIYQGAIADIQRAPPAVLVISTSDLRAMLSPPRSDFARWVDRHYRDRGEFEGMHILVLCHSSIFG